jgi:hypothetical protein
MSISAMKYALDVLENYVEDPRCEAHRATAVHFLEQAIAEAEKQEAVAWMWKDGTLTSDPDFADGTWTPLFTAPVHDSDMSQECVDETAKYRHEWVEQPDLARVGEVGVWGEEKNT